MKLVSESEAAEMCGMSISFLRQARWRGEGPAHSKLGNRVRYDIADIESWVREHLQPGCQA
jgi:predicted DNA-binding transcriptional regulator AlpA